MNTFVLLHGWGMPSAVFEPLARELSGEGSVPVRAIDLPGYNGTRACEPYTLEAMRDSVARAAPRRCIAVGWSLGAFIAAAWAIAAPHQVQRLVLIAATPCFARRHDWPCAVDPAVLQAFAESLRADAKGTLRRFIALQALDDEKAQRVSRALLRAADRIEPPASNALENGLRILLETDLRGALGQLPQPTLVVNGARDRLVPLAAGAYLAENLRNAQLDTIAGAAHAPFVDRAPQIAGRILDFVNG